MADHSIIADLHTCEMLQELLHAGHVLILHRADDGIYTGNAGRKHSAATTLEGMIEELTDRPRRKVCKRPDCAAEGQPRPLWTFGPDKDAADGRASVCKSCESRRVAGIGKRKKSNGAGNDDKPVEAGG